MTKGTAVWNGFRIGLIMTDIILAAKFFTERNLFLGFVMIMCTLILTLQLIKSFRRSKPRIEVTFHRIDKLPEEEAEEILKIVGKDRIMTKSEADELWDEIEMLEQENVDLQKQNLALKKIIKEQISNSEDILKYFEKES